MHRHLGVRQLQEVHGVAEVSSGLGQRETGRKGSDVLPPLFFLIFFCFYYFAHIDGNIHKAEIYPQWCGKFPEKQQMHNNKSLISSEMYCNES